MGYAQCVVLKKKLLSISFGTATKPLLRGVRQSLFRNSPWEEWLSKNLQYSCEYSGGAWNLWFMYILWMLWKHRCTAAFDGLPVESQQVIHAPYLLDQLQLLTSRSTANGTTSRAQRFIRWIPPDAEFMKINVDGARNMHTGEAGAGGIIRNSSGNWYKGFQVSLGVCSGIEAEVYAFRYGLLLALSLQLTHVHIETDDADVLKFLDNDNGKTHPLGGVILDILAIKARFTKIIFSHTPRECNFCADRLAKGVCGPYKDLLVIDEPPDELGPLIEADAQGVVYFRGTVM